MSNGKSRRKRRQGRRSSGRKRGGLLLGMRSGFKGVAGAMTGEEQARGKYKWLGRAITLLLVAAAIGLLAQRL